jgi:hypothetical protein
MARVLLTLKHILVSVEMCLTAIEKLWMIFLGLLFRLSAIIS